MVGQDGEEVSRENWETAQFFEKPKGTAEFLMAVERRVSTPEMSPHNEESS